MATPALDSEQQYYSGPGRGAELAHMLVVDDENGPRQALRMLLKEDYTVHMASGVQAALEVLKQEKIDLIITDIRMPNQTGLDLLREVKRGYPDIQVIMLTGYGQLDTAVEAIHQGAFAYIEKPFDSEKMLEKIRAGLDKRRRRQERRNMEYLALEANRFETLGHLVGGALHDMGGPLSVIGSHLELLAHKPDRHDLVDRLETMRSQVAHCNDLVRTTMNYLRRSPEDRTTLNLNAVAGLCLDISKPFLMGQNIQVVVSFAEDLGVCEGNMVLVRQAVINLIHNACQAMQDCQEPRQLLLQTWSEEESLCFSVQDNGPGIPEEDRERIFEALYTIKGNDGTGLGLAVVRNVMSRHNGTVELMPHKTAGARFVLRFPKTM